MKRTFVLLAGLLIFIILVNKFSVGLIFDRTSYETPPGINLAARSTILPLLNYDGRHYLEISQNGYQNKDKLLAFFPFYPLVVKTFSLNGLINPVLTGLFISFTSAFLALFYLYKLVKIELQEKTARRVIYLLMAFPSSFYLLSFFPEALFLLLSVLTFYFVKSKQYYYAAIFAALATSTRLIGIALLLSLIYEGYQYYKTKNKLPIFLIIAPLGILIYAMFIFFKFGDPFYILGAQTDPSFGRNFSLLNPLVAIWESFNRVLLGPQPTFDNNFVYPVIVLELFWAIFGLSIILLSYKKIYSGYWIFMVAVFIIPLMSGVLSANVRHLLVNFPIFIFLATILKGKYLGIWLITSILLLVFSSVVFLRGYWIA